MKHLIAAIFLCATLSACGMKYNNNANSRAATLNSGWDYEMRDPKKHQAHDEWDRNFDGAYDDWPHR